MDWFDASGFGGSRIRDRIGDHLLALVDGLAHSNRYGIPGQHAYQEHVLAEARYHRAAARLRARGLLAEVTRDGRRFLDLTEEARAGLPVEANPERRWKSTWGGSWYVFTYDVPMAENRHRHVLRRFLRNHRFGLLQRSVWVTPFDCRAWFADLREAASMDDVAYLMKVDEFSGCGPESIAGTAWPWSRIHRGHAWFIEQAEAAVDRVEEGKILGPEDLRSLLHESFAAMRLALADDPLLPHRLLPPNYRGMEVWTAYRRVTDCVQHALLGAS